MIDCLDRLEQIEGSGEDITLSKVSIYGLKGERKKALASLKQLVAEHPYDINYQVMMGNWLMQNGGESEAPISRKTCTNLVLVLKMHIFTLCNK